MQAANSLKRKLSEGNLQSDTPRLITTAARRRLRRRNVLLKHQNSKLEATRDVENDQSASDSNALLSSNSTCPENILATVATSSSPEKKFLTKSARRRMRRGLKTARTGQPREQSNTFSALLLNNLHPQSTSKVIESLIENLTGYNTENCIYYIEVRRCSTTFTTYALISFLEKEHLMFAYQKFQTLSLIMGLPFTVAIETSSHRGTYLESEYQERYKKFIASIRKSVRFAQIKFKQEIAKNKSKAGHMINGTKPTASENKGNQNQTDDSTSSKLTNLANSSPKTTQNDPTQPTQNGDHSDSALDVAIKTEQLDNHNESSNDSVKTTILIEEPDNVDESVPETQESVDIKPNLDTLYIFGLKDEPGDSDSSLSDAINDEINNIDCNDIKQEPIDAENNDRIDKEDSNVNKALNDPNKLYNAIQEVLSDFDIAEVKEEPMDGEENNNETVDLTSDADSLNVSTKSTAKHSTNNISNMRTAQLYSTNTNTRSRKDKPFIILSSEGINSSVDRLQNSTDSNIFLIKTGSVNNTETYKELNDSNASVKKTSAAINKSNKTSVNKNRELKKNSIPSIPQELITFSNPVTSIQSTEKVSMEVESSMDQEIDESDENHCKVLYFKNLPKKIDLLEILRGWISEHAGVDDVKIHIIRNGAGFTCRVALVYVPTHELAVHICKKMNGIQIAENQFIDVALDIGHKVLKKYFLLATNAITDSVKQKLTSHIQDKKDEPDLKKYTKEIVDAFFNRGHFKDVESSSDDYGFKPKYLEKMCIKPPLSPCLIVHDLHELVDEAKLHEVFSLAGDIKQIAYDKEIHFAKIVYDHPVEAVQAIHMFRGHKLFGKDIKMIMPKRNPTPMLPLGLSGINQGLGVNGQPLKGVRANIELNTTHEILYELGKMNKFVSKDICAPFSAWYGRKNTAPNLAISEPSTSYAASNLNSAVSSNDLNKNTGNIQESNDNAKDIKTLSTILKARGLIPADVDCKEPKDILAALSLENWDTSENTGTKSQMPAANKTGQIGTNSQMPATNTTGQIGTNKQMPATNTRAQIGTNSQMPATNTTHIGMNSQMPTANKTAQTWTLNQMPATNTTGQIGTNRQMTATYQTAQIDTNRQMPATNQTSQIGPNRQMPATKQTHIGINSQMPQSWMNSLMSTKNTTAQIGTNSQTPLTGTQRPVPLMAFPIPNPINVILPPINVTAPIPMLWESQIPRNNVAPCSSQAYPNPSNERMGRQDNPSAPRVEKKSSEEIPRLIFKNLPPSVTKEELNKKMREVGGFLQGEISAGRNALVGFKSSYDADRCYRLFHRSRVDGQVIEVLRVSRPT